MTHSFHPAATAAGVLSVHCQRCTTMKVGELDDDHLKHALGISPRNLRDGICGWSPHIQRFLLGARAIEIQALHIGALQEDEETRATGERLEAAAMAAPPVRPEVVA